MPTSSARCDETAKLLARIDEAEASRRAAEERRDSEAVPAPGRLAGDLRVAGHVDPPALVVGQVEMEAVDFLPGETIEQAVKVGDGIGLAGYVEMHAAPAESGAVLDLAGRGE